MQLALYENVDHFTQVYQNETPLLPGKGGITWTDADLLSNAPT